MTWPFRYEMMDSGRDTDAVARLLSHAFAGTAEGVKDWLTAAGLQHMRVVRMESGAPGACLLRIPMAQYFGGRSVPMLGIAGVGTAPEARGRGLARMMMQQEMREAARDGFPISVLYPSTQALYRQAGYEQAGHHLLAKVPLATIDIRERGAPIEHLADADDPAVKAAYTEFAARFDGMVDRGPYVWGRVKKFRENVHHGFGLRGEGGRLDGYLFLHQHRKPDGRQEVLLSDFVFRTPEAGRRLLGFLADFATMGDEAHFSCGPSHPALYVLSQQRYKIEFREYWMLRILSVERALAARGYAPGLDAEVHLDIADDVVPENAGRFVLRVKNGTGEVSRGGNGDLRADIRALAAIFTGHMSPSVLSLCGMASGTDPAMRTAAALFAGTGPWMTDFF